MKRLEFKKWFLNTKDLDRKMTENEAYHLYNDMVKREDYLLVRCDDLLKRPKQVLCQVDKRT